MQNDNSLYMQGEKIINLSSFGWTRVSPAQMAGPGSAQTPKKKTGLFGPILAQPFWAASRPNRLG